MLQVHKKREKIDTSGCVTVEYPYYVFDAPNTRGSVCAKREKVILTAYTLMQKCRLVKEVHVSCFDLSHSSPLFPRFRLKRSSSCCLPVSFVVTGSIRASSIYHPLIV